MSTTPPDWSSLLPALLDFERSPGRYAVVLREPRPLFEHTLTLLQLAAGRSVDGLADLAQDPAQTDELRRAARFFVRTVLLRPGVDHYTLLGLAPGCDAAELREHYRLMIRLTHPDFAAGRGEAWPADAATRINQANDVLSSFGRRSDYDAALASAQPVASAAAAAAAAVPKMPAAAARGGGLTLRPKKEADAAADRTGPRVPRGLKIALVSLGALGAATALLLNGPAGDSGSLVVRKLSPVATPALPVEAVPPPVSEAAVEPVRTAPEAAVRVAGTKPVRAERVTTVRAEPPSPVRTEPVEGLAQYQPVAAPAQPRRSRASPEPAETGVAGQGGGAADEAALSLAMDARMAVSAATPVALVVTPAVAAPPVAATPVVVAAPVALPKAAAVPAEPAPAPAPARAPLPAPTLAQVQPALSRLMGSLPGARGEHLAHWIDADFRAHPDTGRFVNRFNQLLAGQRVTQLGAVRFSARTQGEQLVVEGVIQLHTLGADEQARVRDLHLRAFFQPHEGRTALTQLVAGSLP